MKNWILKTFFNKELNFLFENAKIAGSKDAFEKAREDLEETRINDIEEKAKELSDKRISEMLGFTDEKHIITYSTKNGIIFIGNERCTPEQLINLRQEAEYILSTNLWKVIKNTVGDQARQRMFEKSQSYEDMRSGKMALYNLSLIEKIMQMLKSSK